jgi:uncharacterized YccA/Bax inhibitor family protein
MRIRSTNPYFNRIEKQTQMGLITDERVASYKGIFLKTLILVATLLISGLGSVLLFSIPYNVVVGILIACPIVALVCAIVGSINIKYAPVCSILYSVFEGLMLGLLTYVLEAVYPGIGIVAVLGVSVVFLVSFGLYSLKIVRVSNFFIKLVSILGVTILITFFLSFLVRALIPNVYNAIANNYGIMIVIYIILIIYGAVCLILDFDRAKMLVETQSPKKAEWWVAFGLIISIVWIYIQFLRLLLIIYSRKK